MKIRMHVIFFGRVQGVFFRSHAQKFASQLDIEGWVRNLNDGSVEALFEGEEEMVNEVLELCRHSQPYAKVDSIDLSYEQPKGDLRGFKIKY